MFQHHRHVHEARPYLLPVRKEAVPCTIGHYDYSGRTTTIVRMSQLWAAEKEGWMSQRQTAKEKGDEKEKAVQELLDVVHVEEVVLDRVRVLLVLVRLFHLPSCGRSFARCARHRCGWRLSSERRWTAHCSTPASLVHPH